MTDPLYATTRTESRSPFAPPQAGQRPPAAALRSRRVLRPPRLGAPPPPLPLPGGPRRRPPLLFVHGGYCDGWCWEPHFLPWFAARGYAAHALSLRGHGGSGGHETMFVAGLDDFAVDVARIASGLPSPPVLIGHSMGAAIVERLLVAGSVRAAALLAPVPPTGLGLVAHRLAAYQPEDLGNLHRLDAPQLSGDGSA